MVSTTVFFPIKKLFLRNENLNKFPKFNNEILRKGLESFQSLQWRHQMNLNVFWCLHVNEVVLMDTGVPVFVSAFIFPWSISFGTSRGTCCTSVRTSQEAQNYEAHNVLLNLLLGLSCTRKPNFSSPALLSFHLWLLHFSNGCGVNFV